MKTKIILIVAVLVFLYSTVNPPWRITVKDSKGHTQRTELVWSYLGDAPRAKGSPYSATADAPYQSSTIAVDVFCLQTLCVLVSATAAFWLVSRPVGRASPRAASPEQQAQVRKDLAALPGAGEDLTFAASHKSHTSN